MYLEQEAYFLFAIGVALVAVLAFAILAVCYAKTRNKNLLWFVGQILFLALAAYFCFQCLRNVPIDSMNSMYSEHQSAIFAKMGICWAISMLCEFIGIWKVVQIKK